MFVHLSIFSSTFFFLSSLRCQRQRLRLGRLSFLLSFLSESISQKLSKVSIWTLEYLLTITGGTHYNKADDPVICKSRVICPCFDIVHRHYGYFFSIIKAINLKLNTLVESVDPNLLTRADNSIQHFIWVIPPLWLRISSKNTISQ